MLETLDARGASQLILPPKSYFGGRRVIELGERPYFGSKNNHVKNELLTCATVISARNDAMNFTAQIEAISNVAGQVLDSIEMQVCPQVAF